MVCSYNDSQCNHQGYCNCRRDNTAEAAAGMGGLILWLFTGIVASFLYPAIKILRSDTEPEANGTPKFAGTLWLFLSPVFGFLSNMLYQIVFAAGACAAGALQSRITGSVYMVGMCAIYLLAMGLALLAFLYRNRQALKLFFAQPKLRTSNKTLIVIGAGVMLLLTGLAGTGSVVFAANGYFSHRAQINAEAKRKQDIITAAAADYDAYVGVYKLITRNDDTLFKVAKSEDGNNLRVGRYDEKASGLTSQSGCLLTPQLQGNRVYFAVSECVVDGKPSPLARIYFEKQKTRTVMDFVYNVRSVGDTLEKIK